ncbi:MAG TPA: type II toxin-antitoxin system VapC family toxin [Acidobacteriota bacterium]|nr:type II toxin-antitoxin system VapC family toxin [Acidobacteriota bacterium]
MIVLDASVLIELLLATRRGRQIADRIAPGDISLHAPHLVDLEVAQTVRRCVFDDTITTERGRQALESLRELDLERHSHELYLPRIWELRHNLTAYDAAYVSLAEILGATLLTGDIRLANAPGIRVRIEMF